VGRCRRLTILTTTRIPLGLTSETTYPLPQLDGPTSSELFTQRARAARPGVELLPAVVDRLCAQLDGLPLAIELAAARTRVMSVAEVERRLADRFALLRGGSRTAPERHQTLEAVIDWSWNLLSPDERDALRLLSAFQDGFGLEAAEAMLGAADALAIVESLASQSLLTVTEPAVADPDALGEVRYRMLETVREFGLRQLAVAHQVDLADQRLRAWGRSVATVWGPRVFGPDVYTALDRLRLEEGNLDHILRLAIAEADA
jgi:predicted ATPase